MLFHGTLLRHLPSIEANGLLPTVGEFTKNVYGVSAPGVVPAVFMADELGLERVVHALVAAVMDEITDADYEEFDIGPHFHLNDELFFRYTALLLIETSGSFSRTGSPLEGVIEPEQAEEGDWYSVSAVTPSQIITGDAFESFLVERGLTPSAINDFVDPVSRPISVLKGI